MSKEKKWEERIDDLLGEFGLTRAEALKGHLKFDDKVGEINILDEVKPRMITVKNVDDAKRFAGVPDEDYNEELSKYFDILPPCPGEYNKLAPADLEPKQQQDIKHAMISYVFGNSQKVKSYKDIINKVHFPMKVPLLTGENLTVYTGQKLNLSASAVYDTITVYKGGQFNCTADITVKVNNLVQSPDVKYPPQAAQSLAAEDTPPTITFGSVGSDGNPGNRGGNGSPGSKGATGTPSASGKNYCATTAGEGGPGGNGTHATTGGRGGDGVDGNPLTVDAGNLEGNIVLVSSGGDGGPGGPGGTGGNGGDGGDGGAGSAYCGQGTQGPGGTGGRAGDGGPGGDGGNGNPLIVTYNTIAPGANITLGDPKGRLGVGGSPGAPGNPGNPGGHPGDTGIVGENGTNGQPGTITVNGQVP